MTKKLILLMLAGFAFAVAKVPANAREARPVVGFEPGSNPGGTPVDRAGGPDGYGYVFKDDRDPGGPVYNWIDTVGATNTGIVGEDTFGIVNLPFAFTFYGTSYNRLYVCTNGWASFSAGGSWYGNDTLPQTTIPAATLCPLWDDLACGSDPYHGNIKVKTVGTTPNRRFAVIWNRVGYLSPPHQTFEIVLHETSNEFWFQYRSLDGVNGLGATVGEQQSQTGSNFLQYSAQHESLADGRAIRFWWRTDTLDAGCVAITAPSGVVDTGTFLPQATVRNFGLDTASFNIRFRATGPESYSDVQSTFNLAPGATAGVSFSPWHVTTRGSYTLVCSTELAGDQDPASDRYARPQYIGPQFRVLVCAAESLPNYPYLGNAIRDSSGGMISSADWQNSRTVRLRRPDSLISLGYRAILTFGGSYPYYDSVAFGDTLAKFMELGGGVVVTVFDGVAGRYGAQYKPVPPAPNSYQPASLGTVYAPSHPVMTGVSAVSITGYRCGQNSILHPAYTTRVADWNSGNVQCAAYDSAGVRSVFLGFFPVTEFAQLGGQWVRQLVNALKWVPGTPAVIHNVGCPRLTVPNGTIDSGATVAPACTVFNFGTVTEAFSVRMKIGTGYNRTATVTNLLPAARAFVTFPAWTADRRGANAVSCSTELTGDPFPVDDRATATATVVVRDAECLAVTAPSGPLDSGVTITPQASVRNNGSVAATFPVRLSVTGGYSDTQMVTGLAPGALQTVSFADWTAALRGNYRADCAALLSRDMVPVNDARDTGGTVEVHDVGAGAVVAPTGTVAPGAVVTPQGRVRNRGTLREACSVTFLINSAIPYRQTVALPGGLPLADTVLDFPGWSAVEGNYVAACSAALTGDQVPNNNVIAVPFNCAFAEPGWVRKADVPAGAKSKKVKDGGALAYMAQASSFKLQARTPESGQPGACGLMLDSGFVYAFKGNGRYEFYRFNTVSNVWNTMESIPAIGSAGKKKPVKKGSFLTAAGGSIYGAKGNNTVELWAYDPATDAWTERASVPLGGKALKEGVGAVTVTVHDSDFIYLLKGGGTTEFYCYDVAANTWLSRASAPLGVSGKSYKNGSCLATNGMTIWALKGSYNELAAYDIATEVWSTETGLPMIGTGGKKKKVKDGAGMAYHNGFVYALKGGNTVELWSYEVSTDRWTQLADVPAGSGRNVKGGGAMTSGTRPHPALYCFKGNNTLDFFKYGFGAMTNDQAPMTNAGVQSGSSFRTPHSALRISPNPFSTATTISYSLPTSGNVSLKLYDITGKLVTTLAEGHRNAGTSSLRFQPSSLSGGIYIVRLETDNVTATTKLIVE